LFPQGYKLVPRAVGGADTFVLNRDAVRISSTVLARVMGHESTRITERKYIHLFDQVRTDELVRAAMSAA